MLFAFGLLRLNCNFLFPRHLIFLSPDGFPTVVAVFALISLSLRQVWRLLGGSGERDSKASAVGRLFFVLAGFSLVIGFCDWDLGH